MFVLCNFAIERNDNYIEDEDGKHSEDLHRGDDIPSCNIFSTSYKYVYPAITPSID